MARYRTQGYSWPDVLAQHGVTYLETGLPPHLGDIAWHPLAATWLANLNHLLRFFQGTEDLDIATLDEAGSRRIAVPAVAQRRPPRHDRHPAVVPPVGSHVRSGGP